ncbi:MAG: RIP metalloprotease RseP [Methylophaga sp.]|uniref:RIP metalloprotease RseP n=2 Tax=unclassified Methylophaga TaxID=2629249 RepID=UPI000C4D0805|nr:RIP metalloprotease RseP [Methylophaga sp. UBA678]MAX53173.1 RIP metalloprotease RseP [Methylophaga sp.]|tara:strand:+ start:43673 stop:45010 length:1338 start_codon:yes stop_codon:yes gene_type:complete
MHSLIFFLIALAILIIIHEYGHFWVARRCGVKVLRFSVGFGKPIWQKVGKDGTEYVLAPIPMGGYVKMLDEREMPVSEEQAQFAFNRQSLAKRVAIVSAGPIANLIFAILAYWMLFVVGVSGIKPIIDDVHPDSIAAQAGLNPNDEILQVDGKRTPTWNSVYKALIQKAEYGERTEILVLTSGIEQQYALVIPQVSIDQAGSILDKIGIEPLRPAIKPVLGEIVPDSPAQKAGLKVGDVLLSSQQQTIDNWSKWVELIQASAGKELNIEIQRNEQRLTLTLTPQAGDDGKGRIGAAVDASQSTIPQDLQAELSYGPVEAVWQAVIQTWDFSSSTLKSLWGMITGKVSTDNLGGPISIAQIAGSSAEQGVTSFISFLAMISITLGILNLLPIPMLDGGHLAMFAVEAVRGKPISEITQMQIQKVGFLILIMVMFIAFFNDLTRVFG